MIKPKYYDKENTPLFFLHLVITLSVFGCILGTFRVIIEFIGLISGSVSFFYVCLDTIFIILQVIALRGLCSWSWYGAQMMLVDLGLYTILNSTLILLDDRYFLEDSLPRFIGAILGGLIVLVPIWFYLCRRRPLFKPYINNESQYNIAKTSKKQNPNTHIMICPQCGTVYSCQPGKWNCKHCNSLLIDININKSAWELMSVSKRNELIKKICPSFGKSESNYTSSPASNNVRSQIAQQNPDFKQVIKDEKVTKITDDSMQSIIGKCASCNHELKKGWIVCPNCGEPVKQLCPQCKAEIKDSWKICPFCGEKLK